MVNQLISEITFLSQERTNQRYVQEILSSRAGKRDNCRQNGHMKNGELRLNRKQCLYVEGVAAGKSRRRAALDAGYSMSSANNPAHNIERGRVREIFGELIRGRISAELIVQRIREGLDATETKAFAYEGGVIYSKPLVAWSERRQYVELAARFGGYYVDKKEIELADQSDHLTEEQVREKARALLAALDEADKSQP